MTLNIEHAVREWLIRHHVTDQNIVVAVSGGVDSVTLLHILAEVQHDLKLRLSVAHVDHSLRGIHSDADRDFVHKLCDDLAIPCRSIIVDVAELASRSGTGMEATARDARYEFFQVVSSEMNAKFVATAHTLNDNVETFLMNSARGSGLDGLSAIPPVRVLHRDVCVIRPLLDCTRENVVFYAEDKGLSWRHDDSNDALDYTRNRVRHLVVPAIIEALGPSALVGFNTTLSTIRSVRQGVQDMLAHHIQSVHRHADGAITVPIETIHALPIQMRGEFLHRAVHGASLVDIERLLSLVDAAVGTSASLSGRMFALRERQSINVAFQHEDQHYEPVLVHSRSITSNGDQTLCLNVLPAPIEVRGSDTEVCFDADHIVGQLTWRNWQDGDRLQPFGLHGTVLVSDLLTNARVDHGRRKQIRVLTDEQGILWVCGFRRCDRALVTKDTQNVLIATHTHTKTDD